jgi:hypothetical protein
MTSQRLSKTLSFASALLFTAAASHSAFAQLAASNIPAINQISIDLGVADASTPINIAVHLKLPDKVAFDTHRTQSLAGIFMAA